MSHCPMETDPGVIQFLEAFNRRALEQRVPLAGNIDLTHRCNLRCMHCYTGNQERVLKKMPGELDTDQWLQVIDDIADAGCLNLLVTGGEPLLRTDFAAIYRKAKTRGLLVTLFTNGTLVKEETAALLAELPPRAVEISLYGATAKTHDHITGRPGSFEKAVAGIERLIEKGVKVKLKTVLMKTNLREFSTLQDMAGAWGIKFRFDAGIFPTLDGDKSPLSLRVDTREAVELEFSDPLRVKQWREYFTAMKDRKPVEPDRLYRCGAGRSHFHIDPYGNLKPCLLITDININILEEGFSAGWQKLYTPLGEKKASAGYPCKDCDKKVLCGFCPAFFKMENGSEEFPSKYLCEMGRLRLEKVNQVA